MAAICINVRTAWQAPADSSVSAALQPSIWFTDALRLGRSHPESQTQAHCCNRAELASSTMGTNAAVVR